VNVVHVGTNDHWRRQLDQFVDENDKNESLRLWRTILPQHYSWDRFQEWMSLRMKYDSAKHRVILAQSGKDKQYHIEADTQWHELLEDVANGFFTVPKCADLNFILRPREPLPVLPLIGPCTKIPDAECIAREAALAESKAAAEAAPKETDTSSLVPIVNKTWSSDKLAELGVDRYFPRVTGEVFPSILSQIDGRVSTNSMIEEISPATPSHNGNRGSVQDEEPPRLAQPTTVSSPSSPSSLTSSDFSDFEIIDIPAGEYNVQQSQDNDYGAVDEGFVDTQIGSYNTGDTEAEWQQCVKFFRLKVPSSGSSSSSTSTRKRVLVAKLPGMSVGLFDYQLMAVLKMLGFTTNGLSGGFLADEQGLGKTQEMFGLIAAAHNIRKSKNEVNVARKSKVPTKHNAADKRSTHCSMDVRYGLRCYCYSKSTQAIAGCLPEGPTVIIVPARSCAQILREAKTKLDLKTLKIRLHHETAAKEDKLTSAEVRSITAAITAKTGTDDGTVEYHYQVNPGLSDFVIITTPESLGTLTNGVFSVDVKVGDERKKRDGLLPGMVMLDEFHEYLQDDQTAKNKTLAWLQHLKKSCRGSNQTTPLVYFVSGTPFSDSPGDIRPAISLLEREEWTTESHDMAPVTTAGIDNIVSAFDGLCKAQTEGLELNREDIVNYRRLLDGVLSRTLVRRLGTNSFRDQPLTTISPLGVNIVDHEVPQPLLADLQSLAEATATLIQEEAAGRYSLDETGATPLDIGRFLRSDHSQDFLLKLRLASIFPGIATVSGADFTFTTSEVTAGLAAANNDPTKTRYYPLIGHWASHSAKLATLNGIITTMLSDKTPIPGEASNAKKLVIFTPLEAEAALLHAYLVRRKATLPALKALKPVSIHSGISASARQGVIDKFLEQGNAPPNVLVAPMALAGTGLNFQRAKYSVVTGPAWTKRENQQAYYRIHRVGQKQQAKLSLLTARWNPAERVVLARYEGREVMEEGRWEVSSVGDADESAGLVERHQAAAADAMVEEASSE